MPLTKIQPGSYASSSIRQNDISANVTSAFATTDELGNYATTATLVNYANPRVSSVAVANSSFAILDDTAVSLDGGYIVITGANFAEGIIVLIDTTSASAVTRINSTTLRVQVPAKAASSYNLFLVNPDGGTGIRVNGITYSANPTWVTASPLTSQPTATTFNINLNATSATSYALAAGSTLPAGTTLLANGYFYGTVTVANQTTYSFDVVATDAENQDSSKTFGLTITVAPPQRLYAVGQNWYGAVGLEYQINTLSPIQVGTDTNWSSINMFIPNNSNQVIPVFGHKLDGTLWAWGRNRYGQLGLNDRIDRSSPVQVGTDTNWKYVRAYRYSSETVTGIKTNGTLWQWGSLFLNASGGLVYRSSPVQVGTDTNWDKLSLGQQSGMAIKTNGTLWAWGDGDLGVLGLNDTIDRSSPVQVGALTNWKEVMVSQGRQSVKYCFAIKTDGTLWSWGSNNQGQLGHNGAVNVSSPVQVGSSTDWSKVEVADTTFAIKNNGSLWASGNNARGQLGLGYQEASYTRNLTQVGTLTNWKQVKQATNPTTSITHTAVFGVKTDGTLWGWGSNYYGVFVPSGTQLSPIQIGSNTNWESVHAGSYNYWAITKG